MPAHAHTAPSQPAATRRAVLCHGDGRGAARRGFWAAVGGAARRGFWAAVGSPATRAVGIFVVAAAAVLFAFTTLSNWHHANCGSKFMTAFTTIGSPTCAYALAVLAALQDQLLGSDFEGMMRILQHPHSSVSGAFPRLFDLSLLVRLLLLLRRRRRRRSPSAPSGCA